MKLLQSYFLYFIQSDYEFMEVSYRDNSVLKVKTYWRDADLDLPPSITPVSIQYKTWKESRLSIENNTMDLTVYIESIQCEYYMRLENGNLTNFEITDEREGIIVNSGNGAVLEVIPEEDLFQDSVCDNHFMKIHQLQLKLLRLKERLLK